MTSQFSLHRSEQPGAASPARNPVLGWWKPVEDHPPASGDKTLIEDLGQPLWLIEANEGLQVVGFNQGVRTAEGKGYPVVGYVPGILPEGLGDRSFCQDMGIRYPYISGAMANGIGSVDIAVAMGKAGMLGFFGAAGLSPAHIADAINQLKACQVPFGVNLIHAPKNPQWEEAVVDLLLAEEVRRVEASAYLDLTLPVVRYRVSGIHEDHTGRVVAPNQIIAKVSRIEVGTKFFSPPPEKFLNQLVAGGHISQHQAQLARRIPMAVDLTAEADSGGHTDNRPALTLLPTMVALRDQMQAMHPYDTPLRVGLAGGIATPASCNAAFAMGAAFVLVGSVHQACVESGTSDVVREMLAQARQADIAMAPAADMFEMGVNLQVLKRGTMFPMRAARLYELYRAHSSIDQLSQADRLNLETKIFRAPLEEIWQQTHAFFSERDPAQITRAQSDPKHKMALIFRWYLGKSSSWANRGDTDRRVDFQVWCGPSMGAFNEWVRGSFLQDPTQRRVTTVAQNLLFGAACLTRLNHLRAQGYPVTPELQRMNPREPDQLKEFFT